MVSLTPLLRPAALACLTAALCACSQDESGSGSGDGARLYHLAGTVAVGRPGQWANVCIDDDCTRANNAGNYRLSLPLTRSALIHADVPEVDGKITRLTSLYRHASSVRNQIVNMNPTTTALLEAWSQYRMGQTLEDCLDASILPGCERSLVDSFSLGVQEHASARLGNWLGTAWSSNPPRDPFSDLYLADPALDWLDDLHDHFHFNAAAAELELNNNNDILIGTLPYIYLFGAYATSPLDPDVITDAKSIPPDEPDEGDNLIVMFMDVSPGRSFDAPRTIRLDASDTYSKSMLPNNTLTFRQELVDPDGNVRRFNDDNLTTDVTRPGPHTWIVTVTDDAGNLNTEGIVLQVSSKDPTANPSFGAAGSCPTDPTQMNANSVNFCEEPLDGGKEYGVCIPVPSGSYKSIHSPARCSTTSQNGGALLGVCTELSIELRVFFYVNPYRDTGETFEQQRSRWRTDCLKAPGTSWSNQPEN